jgi:hypothetical protein
VTLLHPGRTRPSRTRPFPLGDVLTVATGHMVSTGGMADVQAVVDWMAGRPVSYGELLPFAADCRAGLLRQYPAFADVVVPKFPDVFVRWDWLAGQAAWYGSTCDVAPLSAPCWQCVGATEPPYGEPCRAHRASTAAAASAQAELHQDLKVGPR